MRNYRKAMTSILAAVLLAALSIPVSGAPQNTGSSAESDVITSLMTVQDRLNAIEAKKGESEAYLSELKAQLTELSGQLNTLQDQYSEKRAELDLVSQQLTDAEKTASEQRRNMALRIQYMYENSMGSGFLDAVFSSDNFQDILTRAENIKELSEFDRRMLAEYVAVCEDIETKQKTVEQEQKEISRLEGESLEKRAEIQTLYEETLSDIQEMTEAVKEGHEEEARLLTSIQEQEAQLAVFLTPAAQQVAAAEQYAQGVHAASTDQYAQGAYAAPTAGTGTNAAQNSVSGDSTAAGTEQKAAESESAAETGDTAAAESAAETGSAAAESAGTQTASEKTSSWDGSVLTRASGVNQGPSGKETYYNLNMSGVVDIMRNMGNTDQYWVRDDGVKMLGDYVMVAADLETHPRGSIVESSLGEAIVVDTGALEKEQLDIAVTW